MASAISVRRSLVVLVTVVAFAVGAARPALAARPQAEAAKERISLGDRLLSVVSKKTRVKIARVKVARKQRMLQLAENKLTANDIKIQLAALDLKTKRTFGDKVADTVNAATSSWAYLGGGLGLVGAWLYANSTGHPVVGVDSFNLGISILTWAAGPLIMKYQSRQSKLEKRRQELFLKYMELTEEESRHAEEHLNEMHDQLSEALDKIGGYEASLGKYQLKLDKLIDLVEKQDKPAPDKIAQDIH